MFLKFRGKNASLSTKLNKPLVLIGLIFIFLLSSVVLIRGEQRIHMLVHSKSENITQNIMLAVKNNPSQVNLLRIISALAVKDNIVRLGLIHKQSQLLIADNDHAKIQKPFIETVSAEEALFLNTLLLRDDKHQEFKINQFAYQVNVLHLIDPAVNRLRPYLIFLKYDTTADVALVHKEIAYFIVISGFGILFMLFSVYLILQKILIKPLAVILQLLTAQKNSTQQLALPTNLNDELGLLAQQYNELNTEKMNQAIELKKAKEAAECAAVTKTEFLATMTHEIRTPMNGVLGMSELLSATTLDVKQRDYMNTIISSGQLLLTIINDILDYSKLEAGKVELESAAFSMPALIEGVLVVLRTTILKNIELKLDYPIDCPTYFIGDTAKIRQIMFPEFV